MENNKIQKTEIKKEKPKRNSSDVETNQYTKDEIPFADGEGTELDKEIDGPDQNKKSL